jgi:hypothetical protein
VTPVERMLSRTVIDPASGCWLWTGCKIRGYGQTSVGGGKRGRVHRVSYEHFRGPIPEGLTIDHLCRTPACLNPEHLEAVTSAVNTMRGVGPSATNARKSHCNAGHPLAGANLCAGAPRRGRECRTCRRDACRERRRMLAARKGAT